MSENEETKLNELADKLGKLVEELFQMPGYYEYAFGGPITNPEIETKVKAKRLAELELFNYCEGISR